MAISNTTTKNEYTLDALTTTFSITFDVVKDDNGDAKDLLVSLVEDGETTVLVRNTDYTVSDLTVTYADAVNHAGATLIVARNTPRTQETDFVNNGSYNLQQIEDMSDKLTRIAQEQDTDISDKIIYSEELVEQAQESADNAYASEQKAHDWADKAPDVEVETGEYSAKHWASKASTSAGAASVSAYDASVYAGQASSARGQSASYALVSEGYANGEQSGTPVGSDSPYYQNNSKYWAEVAKQYATGGLFYVGVWTITSQTDYSAISTPRKKGDLFYCQGTSTTIDGVTYTSGDFIVFNTDVASGTTITTSMIDKIDNTETVTPDNTCTLENKTIPLGDNDITTTANKVIVSDADGNIGAGSVDANKIVSTDGTQTLTNKTIESADNSLNIDRADVHMAYSTTEQKTGDTFNGLDVYARVINIGGGDFTKTTSSSRVMQSYKETIPDNIRIVSTSGWYRIDDSNLGYRDLPVGSVIASASLDVAVAGEVEFYESDKDIYVNLYYPTSFDTRFTGVTANILIKYVKIV